MAHKGDEAVHNHRSRGLAYIMLAFGIFAGKSLPLSHCHFFESSSAVVARLVRIRIV